MTTPAADLLKQVETRIEERRRTGIATAVQLIRDGRPGLALYTITRSVQAQARLADITGHTAHPTCPCSGMCEHGKALA